jgi:hypothetical protein
MGSLTSQRGTSGPENFQSSARKDFFNNIGAKRPRNVTSPFRPRRVQAGSWNIGCALGGMMAMFVLLMRGSAAQFPRSLAIYG